VHLLRTGQPAARPSPEEVEETVMWHLEALYGLYGEERGVRVARKHLAWYCGGAEKAGEFLMRVCAAQSAAEQRRLAREHFGGSGAWQARGRAA
jgi:tRNA-dihydrouridine synthase B